MRALWIGFFLVAAATGRERHPLAGSWYVEGTARMRHLGGAPLALDGVWDDALGDVSLVALGPGLRLTGRPVTGERRALELVLTRLPNERLEAVLRVDGKELARERWARVATPRLQLLSVAPLASGAVAIELQVSGRPLPVVMRVRARAGVALLHEEELAGGAPLAVGRHQARWDGRERSLEERPVEPGTFAIELAPGDGSVLGPAPHEPREPKQARGAVGALEPE